MEKQIDITDKIVLITGANRGIGRALVEEALKRGAKRVYAGTRVPLSHPDPRVKPIILDITNAEQIKNAVDTVGTLDILINNVGISLYDDLSDRKVLEQHLAVNLFGTHDMIQAFLPALTASKGAIVNNLSLLALGPFAMIASYSVSKAAAFSMTQALRAYLAGRGVTVHAVLTGPVDTDMTKGLEMPKTAPDVVAQGIFDGVEKGEEEIFPDPMSANMADGWNNSAIKAFERQNAAMIGQ